MPYWKIDQLMHAKPKTPKRWMRGVSKKQATKHRARGPVRDAYLAAHPWCEAQISPACRAERRRSVDVHEPWKRSAGGPIDDPLNFKALCRGCHMFVHANPLKAYEAGLLIPAHEGAAWLARRHEEAA